MQQAGMGDSAGLFVHISSALCVACLSPGDGQDSQAESYHLLPDKAGQRISLRPVLRHKAGMGRVIYLDFMACFGKRGLVSKILGEEEFWLL